MKWFKRTATALGLVVVMVAVQFLPIKQVVVEKLPMFVQQIVQTVQKSTFTIGMAGVAYAATPDYTVDGTADDVQAQQALNALPSTGGEILFYGGNYVFDATVLRAINNVTISGSGKSTYFAWNASSKLFSTGVQTGWVFKDLRTDAGWITLSADSVLLNIWNDTSYIDKTMGTGATVPASPVVGQMFLHTPTGRSVLLQYSGTSWRPLESYGTIQVYVDGPSGTDNINYGYGTGASAFKTIQYAYNNIPDIYDGAVTITVGLGTYNESLVLGVKNSDTGSFIFIDGTLTPLATNTITSSVQGSGATQGSVTHTGGFTGYANKLLYVTNASPNNNWRIIDSVTADTATIVGTFISAISGNYTVYDWGTTVTGITSVTTGSEKATLSNVRFDYMAFNGSTRDLINTAGSNVEFLACKFNKGRVQEVGGWTMTRWSLFLVTSVAHINAGAYSEYLACKFLGGTGAPASSYALWVYDSGIVRINGGNVFDGIDKVSSLGAIYASSGGHVLNDVPGEASYGYSKFKNWVTALTAIQSGVMALTQNDVFSGNTVDKNPATNTSAATLRDRIAINMNAFWYKNWVDSAGFSNSFVGTGSFTNGFFTGLLATGATNPSKAAIYSTGANFPIYNAIPDYYNRFAVKIHNVTTPHTNETIYIGLWTNPTAPTLTEKHIGFKIINGALAATVGNGSTETASATLLTWAQYGVASLAFSQVGTSVNFYINGVIQAILDTNVPDAASTSVLFHIAQTDTNNHQLEVYPFTLILGDSPNNMETFGYIDN